MRVVWRLLALIIPGAIAASSFLVTGYLSRLERGLAQNIAAARALLEVQSAIRDRNAALGQMVSLTDRIGESLDKVVAQSEAIGADVGQVAQANQVNLAVNLRIEANNLASARDLTRVVAALRSMNQSASAIRDYLSGLRDTAAADLHLLRSVGANTARMNARTPGR